MSDEEPYNGQFYREILKAYSGFTTFAVFRPPAHVPGWGQTLGSTFGVGLRPRSSQQVIRDGHQFGFIAGLSLLFFRTGLSLTIKIRFQLLTLLCPRASGAATENLHVGCTKFLIVPVRQVHELIQVLFSSKPEPKRTWITLLSFIPWVFLHGIAHYKFHSGKVSTAIFQAN